MPRDARMAIIIVDIVQFHQLITSKNRDGRDVDNRHDRAGNVLGAKRAGKKARMTIRKGPLTRIIHEFAQNLHGSQ